LLLTESVVLALAGAAVTVMLAVVVMLFCSVTVDKDVLTDVSVLAGRATVESVVITVWVPLLYI